MPSTPSSVDFSRFTLAAPLVLLIGASLAATQAVAQQRWDISSRDGLVSIFANAASAADIAIALGDATGVTVVVHGEPTTPLTAEIVDVPLDKAIALLAPSHMLVRASQDSDAEIIEVVLMMPDPEGGGVSSAEFLPSGEPADGVVSDETDGQFGTAGTGDIDPDAQPNTDQAAQRALGIEGQTDVPLDLPTDGTLPAQSVDAAGQPLSQ